MATRGMHPGLINRVSVVTLSSPRQNLPEPTYVDAGNFKGLGRWQVVHIGPYSVNVTTPFGQLKIFCRVIPPSQIGK
jgi:hypothetical protein